MLGNRQIGIGAIWLLGVALAGSACSNPELQYKVLSIFFDGVPNPADEKAQPERTAPTEVTDEELEEAFLEVPAKKGSAHGPYVNGRKMCQACHAGRFDSRLVRPKEEICLKCHDPEQMFEGEFWHPPTQAGLCWGCHSPHTSEEPHLLLEKKSEICARCHDGDTFVTQKRHEEKNRTQCLNCHDPHAANKRHVLRNEPLSPKE